MPVYGVDSPLNALLAPRIKSPDFQEMPDVMPALQFWCHLGKIGGYKTCIMVIAARDFEHEAAAELAASPPGE
jgi:hypothetical protein